MAIKGDKKALSPHETHWDFWYVVEYIFLYQKQLKLFLLQLVKGKPVKWLDYSTIRALFPTYYGPYFSWKFIILVHLFVNFFGSSIVIIMIEIKYRADPGEFKEFHGTQW